MQIYHVSPDRNLLSIRIFGIDPQYSLGKRKVCYYATKGALLWAISHTSMVHREQVERLTVWVVVVEDYSKFGATQWQGIFTSKVIQHPTGQIPIDDVILALTPHEIDEGDIPH